MLDRMGMIGAIRDMFEELNDAHRFEVLKEIMGDLDRFNFSGVPIGQISDVYWKLYAAVNHYPLTPTPK